jgi:hypothetical protein
LRLSTIRQDWLTFVSLSCFSAPKAPSCSENEFLKAHPARCNGLLPVVSRGRFGLLVRRQESAVCRPRERELSGGEFAVVTAAACYSQQVLSKPIIVAQPSLKEWTQ